MTDAEIVARWEAERAGRARSLTGGNATLIDTERKELEELRVEVASLRVKLGEMAEAARKRRGKR